VGIVLKNILAIYQRELQSYFASPLPTSLQGCSGCWGASFWWRFCLVPRASLPRLPWPTRPCKWGLRRPFDVAYEFNKAYVGLLGSLSMFVLPMLSMGLYADERKQGTLELLATSPMTNWAVALGKLLAVVTFYIAMILPLMVCQAVAIGAADPPGARGCFSSRIWGWCCWPLAFSLGMFISSLTEQHGVGGDYDLCPDSDAVAD
jgi:ABC-2 type transport system permease protein